MSDLKDKGPKPNAVKTLRDNYNKRREETLKKTKDNAKKDSIKKNETNDQVALPIVSDNKDLELQLMKLKKFSELDVFLEDQLLDVKGCFADTSILFAATYPLDLHNEEAEKVFKILSKNQLNISHIKKVDEGKFSKMEIAR